MIVIETERLILRTWHKSDATSYFQLKQNPQVTEFLLGPPTMEQVINFITLANKHFTLHGYTRWATVEKSSGRLIGRIGLNHLLKEDIFLGPCVEISWHLGVEFWGKGYASEGAQAALKYGFNNCNLQEIIAITVPANIRSISVMKKIGMHRDTNGDFAHPKLPNKHPLSHHILYRIQAPQYTRIIT